jgi:hypothetical protein
VYLRADELASWGLILRVPPRKRDRIAWNDADDRSTPLLTPVQRRITQQLRRSADSG